MRSVARTGTGVVRVIRGAAVVAIRVRRLIRSSHDLHSSVDGVIVYTNVDECKPYLSAARERRTLGGNSRAPLGFTLRRVGLSRGCSIFPRGYGVFEG